jgi:hypothetical protein
MPYTINHYNGQTVTTVQDATVDNTLDIKLIGKNYAGYGEIQNENYVWLLENFASTNAPPNKTAGQIWYDSANKKLKFYDDSKWRTTGGAEVAATAPTGLTTGDFWWDTANDQLYAWNGTQFLLVGPQSVTGYGATQMRSRKVKDSTGVYHPIVEGLVDGTVVFVVSSANFTLDSVDNPITGFATGVLKKGITLSDDSILQGTASAARYADLAEKYLPDADYEVGTVMMVGGEKEVTAAKVGNRALGTISDNPAYMMNSELVGGVYVALKGRVPVKVIGPVTKGDKLEAVGNGIAGKIGPDSDPSNVFSIALETNNEPGVRLVEAVIL